MRAPALVPIYYIQQHSCSKNMSSQDVKPGCNATYVVWLRHIAGEAVVLPEEGQQLAAGPVIPQLLRPQLLSIQHALHSRTQHTFLISQHLHVPATVQPKALCCHSNILVLVQGQCSMPQGLPCWRTTPGSPRPSQHLALCWPVSTHCRTGCPSPRKEPCPHPAAGGSHAHRSPAHTEAQPRQWRHLPVGNNNSSHAGANSFMFLQALCTSSVLACLSSGSAFHSDKLPTDSCCSSCRTIGGSNLPVQDVLCRPNLPACSLYDTLDMRVCLTLCCRCSPCA